MSDQPEALRLADALEFGVLLGDDRDAAAAELRRQHDQIEQLKAERDALQNTKHYEAPRGFVMHPDYLVPELQAERDAAVADAERYRWLRDWERGTHDILPMTGRYGDRAILGDELDAAIDAARGKT